MREWESGRVGEWEKSLSPCLLVSLSPCLLVSLSPCLPLSRSPAPPLSHSPLRLAISSALIVAMRMAKPIITILLALQLFVTTGLCAGLCCGADFNPAAEKAAAPQVESNQAGSESKADSGHCPMHAGKSARQRPQAQKSPSPAPGKQSIATQRHSHRAKSSTAPAAHLCGCSVRREERNTAALLKRSFEERPATQVLFGSSYSSLWVIEASPPNISPHSLQSHSPPFGGFRLHLRI